MKALRSKRMVMVLQITVVLIQILELNKYGIVKGFNGKNIIAAMMIVANIMFVVKYGEIFKFIYKKIESISDKKEIVFSKDKMNENIVLILFGFSSLFFVIITPAIIYNIKLLSLETLLFSWLYMFVINKGIFRSEIYEIINYHQESLMSKVNNSIIFWVCSILVLFVKDSSKGMYYCILWICLFFLELCYRLRQNIEPRLRD